MESSFKSGMNSNESILYCSGVSLQALGALVTAIVISFQAGWKLSFVIFCFAPLMAFAGLLQGQSQSKSGKAKSMKNWGDQGAQVIIFISLSIQT